MNNLPNRLPCLILCFVVALAPLPFGSSDPAVVAIWCVMLGFGLIFADPGSLRRWQTACLGAFVVVVLAFGFVLHEQLAETSWLDLAPNPIWRQASELLDVDLAPARVLVRSQPWFAIGPPMAAILAMSVAFFVGSNRDLAYRVLRVIAWSGAAYAVIAIASYLTDPGKLFWREKTAYATVLTTPFVNRNTAAMYYGTCTVVASLIFWQRLRHALRGWPNSFRELWKLLMSSQERNLGWSGILPIVCFVATLLTGSRAGVALTLAGLVLGFILYFFRDLPRRTGPISALAVGALISIALLQTVGGRVGGRFEQSGLTDPGRAETYRATIRLIENQPPIGSGLGTFASAFPPYRRGSYWGIWDRAHNIFLEIAAEGGLGFALLIAGCWLFVLAILAHGVKKRRRDKIFSVAALTVAIMCLIHAMIDFSLQIPGFAIVVFALTGIGGAQSFTSRMPINPA
jgi:hypothetical protein